MGVPKPLKIPIRVTSLHGKPALDLRRQIHEADLVKTIIDSVMKGIPIVVYPCFTNHFQSLGTLQKLKIINYDFVKNTYEWGEKLTENKNK